jgi:hypothetical protein
LLFSIADRVPSSGGVEPALVRGSVNTAIKLVELCGEFTLSSDAISVGL